MTTRSQLLTTAGVVAFALLLTGVVEAHGGPYAVGAHIGLQLQHQAIQTAVTIMVPTVALPWSLQ